MLNIRESQNDNNIYMYNAIYNGGTMIMTAGMRGGDLPEREYVGMASYEGSILLLVVLEMRI